MSDSPLLPIFQQAYQNTDLTPLIAPEQLAKFRVEYGREALEALIQLIEDHAAQDAKIIFSGHRGCGKSTLLAELSRTLGDRYFVVFFSISETIEMSDVNHINILFAISVNLMLEAEHQQIKIPEATQDSLNQWFAKRTRTEITTPVSAEMAIGFELLKIISGKLKTESVVRDEIKQEFEQKVSELVAKLNEIAATVQAASGKDVLVIIDDLDKLDLAVVRTVFSDHIKTLFLPGFSIIYTIPVSALRDNSLHATLTTETDDQIVAMPVSKLIAREDRHQANSVYQQDAVETLCQVLHHRLPPEILEPEIATQMVLQSGGVLRELVRICNRCCRICLREIRRQPERTDFKIDADVLTEALKDLRLDFETTLGKADYAILQTTYDNLEPEDPKAEPFLDLLHGLQVLEYRNDGVWYDLHPIVTELLVRKGLIDAGG